MQTAKEFVHKVLDSLPDDCSLDEFTYQLYLRRKVEEGLAAIDRGDVYTPEEARRKLISWRESSGPDPR